MSFVEDTGMWHLLKLSESWNRETLGQEVTATPTAKPRSCRVEYA